MVIEGEAVNPGPGTKSGLQAIRTYQNAFSSKGLGIGPCAIALGS